MPAEWEDEFWHQEAPSKTEGPKKSQTGSITLRPPLYNAEDYIAALKLLFSSHCRTSPNNANPKASSVLIEHTGQYANSASSKNLRNREEFLETPPEMSMRKFLNGSELLFKLEADLRHAYPSFVQEFVSVHCEGVLHTLEALKLIQTGLDEVTGLREQRKLFMDEQKCLQCLRLCLRNIEAVSKLSTYPGGLYPIAAAMVSTVTGTRIIALEILTCVCSEGGAEGHFKVSEAISTLRLRLGEPIRCKILIGAISSAPPGTFQAKGIRFLTTWVASAVSPRHKVHIQCELEEAGFNPAALRKAAELGGAREAREVHAELEAWGRVSIDVDKLTRQNCQLRNSVATLQQELATLKDKIKRMDGHPKQEEIRRRSSRPKQIIEDSEEEEEEINEILDDLNNYLNSELGASPRDQLMPNFQAKAIEKDIVPTHLVKSPPQNKNNFTPKSPVSRPWPGSSASDDDDDSDLVPTPKLSPKENNKRLGGQKNVRQAVQEIERSKQLYTKNISKSLSPLVERTKPDYKLINFHQQNHMVSKFANFKSSKLYSSSPDNSTINAGKKKEVSKRYSAEATRFSPELDYHSNRSRTGLPLRRSESLHTSLSSPTTANSSRSQEDKVKAKHPEKSQKRRPTNAGARKGEALDKWKSMDNLEDAEDNFTLRWKYPTPEFFKVEAKAKEASPPKTKENIGMGNEKACKAPSHPAGGVFEIFSDYRQSRFSKKSKQSSSSGGESGRNGSPVNRSTTSHSIFSKYPKKSLQSNNEVQIEKESLNMFSLPPIFVSQGVDITNHRISDLPSGLY